MQGQDYILTNPKLKLYCYCYIVDVDQQRSTDYIVHNKEIGWKSEVQFHFTKTNM